MTDEDDEADRAQALVEGGVELAGASVGAAVGLIGGPPGLFAGAAAGVAATRAFRKLGAEIQQRWLAPRQRIRTGAVYAIAGAQIAARLKQGEQPRTDGFFESAPDDRPAAEELLEGVLQAAADAYEERKVALLGNLYAGLVFDHSIDRGFANLLIRLTERLSFRQLVAMAVVWQGDAAERVTNAAETDPPRAVVFNDEVSLEIDELERLGLVGRGQPGGTPKRGGATFTDAGSLPISVLSLTGPGAELHRLAGLASISESARSEFLDALVLVKPG